MSAKRDQSALIQVERIKKKEVLIVNPNSPQKRIAFGYNRAANNTIVLYPLQAQVVQFIFNFRLEGNSLRRIAMILTACEIPTPNNNRIWGMQVIRNILSNSHYIGDETYPQIIDAKVFERAQRVNK